MNSWLNTKRFWVYHLLTLETALQKGIHLFFLYYNNQIVCEEGKNIHMKYVTCTLSIYKKGTVRYFPPNSILLLKKKLHSRFHLQLCLCTSCLTVIIVSFAFVVFRRFRSLSLERLFMHQVRNMKWLLLGLKLSLSVSPTSKCRISLP